MALAANAATNPEPDVIVSGFLAGGIELPLKLVAGEPAQTARGVAAPRVAYETMRIPPQAQSLTFHVAPNPLAASEPIRIQYRLEGVDNAWQDLEGGMFLSLRFLDASGQRISSATFARAGQSAGWNGDAQSSPFRVVSEVAVVPPRAKRLQVYFVSGGPPRTTGIWLVKRLRLAAAASKAGPETLLLDDHMSDGVDLGQPEGALTNWRREGTNTRTPQVYTQATPEPTHALALIDTDIRNSGSWVAQGKNIVDVEPGQIIRAEIEELFSIGRGGDTTCTYRRIGAGRYVFQAIPVDEFGRQRGVGVSLPIVLVPPFYASGWFWTTVAVAGVAILSGLVRYVTRRKMQRQLEHAERAGAVERERARIARDIHDDMGARLTQISLMSSLALKSTPVDDPRHATLKRMDLTSRTVVKALDEIVWAINPAHDTLDGLANYISVYVSEIAEGSALRYRLEIPALLPARFISSGVRHHLLMGVKEALNNALKHSEATEIRVQLAFADPELTLTISDNGRGFDPQAAATGNGIANMTSRLQAASGVCLIYRSTGGGIRVTFTVQLPPESSSL